MRKTIAFSLACLIALFMMGCSNTSSSTKVPYANNSYVAPTQKTLSVKEKEEIAKRETFSMLLQVMEESSKFSKYDIDATRVNTGSITEKYGKFEVCGTLYLYDKYGSLKDTATFVGTVEVNDNGSYRAYRPIITIK